MADDDTVPADDGRAHITPDGGIAIPAGSRVWVWCQDNVTGHRYDVASTRLPLGGVQVVDGYRLHYGQHGRPAKARQQWQADDAEPGAGGDQQLAPIADQGAPEGSMSGDEPARPVDEPAPELATGGEQAVAEVKRRKR